MLLINILVVCKKVYDLQFILIQLCEWKPTFHLSFEGKKGILNCILLQVSQDMGIEAPVPISAKLGDFNNIFKRIVSSAERPHLSIPETEAGRSRKQYNRLVNRSLMFVSGTPLQPSIYILIPNFDKT